MKIEFNDKEVELLLETLAKAHMVEYLQGRDNSKLDKLIQIVAEELKSNNKLHIFNKIYMEVK